MKFAGIFAFFAALMLTFGNAMAVPAGKTIEFDSPEGKVVFDGKLHAGKGAKCGDCHTKPKLFEMKKGKSNITKKDINDGKFCGACHDGKKSFGVTDKAACGKCHKK